MNLTINETFAVEKLWSTQIDGVERVAKVAWSLSFTSEEFDPLACVSKVGGETHVSTDLNPEILTVAAAQATDEMVENWVRNVEAYNLPEMKAFAIEQLHLICSEADFVLVERE